MLPSSTETSPGLSFVEMPGKFPATRIVRAKSCPTTQVTIGDLNWEMEFRNEAAPSEQPNVKEPSSVVIPGESESSSYSGGATRSHGLLTPHASLVENTKDEDFRSVRSSPPSTSNRHSGSRISEMQFATPSGSSSSTNLLGIPLTPPVPGSESNRNSLSTELVSYASVGVQTSLPKVSSSYASTAPVSPLTPRASPKRKRPTTPDYLLEGRRLALELEDDLVSIARQKRRLKRELARVERKERELQSLLIPSPPLIGDPEEIEIEGENTDTESDSAGCIQFCGRAPLTPESSENEKITLSQAKIQNAPTLTFPTVSSSTGHSLASNDSYTTATSRPSKISADHDNWSITASTDSVLKVPNYTFGEGSSAASGVTSPIQNSGSAHNEIVGLAPNPIRDPSLYLVWFDLETTSAVRPAANIRILEVAVLITDKNYQPLEKGKSFLVHWPLTAEEIASEMSEKVLEMHQKSGLLAAYAATLPKDRLTLVQVERRLCKYLERHDIEPNARAVMAGAGVAFDRGMVRQHMEKLDKYFSHQVFDTTTLWHAIRRKYGRTKRFSVQCAHRTMDDILGSSREARLYSEIVFKPPGKVHWPTHLSQGI